MQPSSSALARREQQPIEGIVINGQQPAPATAQTLLGEFLDNCRGGRPTPRFIGNLAARIKDQLVAGIEPDAVRGGLQILLAKGLHPAALDAAVHQAMNGGSVPMPNGIHPTATEQKLTRAADVAARFRERGE